MKVPGIKRVVCPACDNDDASTPRIHTLQEKQDEEEVGKVIDTKIRLEAVVRKRLAFKVLHSGVENECSDWRKCTTGYTAVDSLCTCPNRGQGAYVERDCLMSAVRSSCTSYDLLESRGGRRVAHGEEPCVSGCIGRF